MGFLFAPVLIVAGGYVTLLLLFLLAGIIRK